MSPLKEGTAWEGTWTLPVCDMGDHNLNMQFGNRTHSQFGMFPCCCGRNCEDSADFVQAANLQNFQTLLRSCNKQLHGTSINFNNVNYGFKWVASLAYTWATFSTGKRAGVAIGFLIVGLLLVSCAIALCFCCLSDRSHDESVQEEDPISFDEYKRRSAADKERQRNESIQLQASREAEQREAEAARPKGWGEYLFGSANA